LECWIEGELGRIGEGLSTSCAYSVTGHRGKQQQTTSCKLKAIETMNGRILVSLSLTRLHLLCIFYLEYYIEDIQCFLMNMTFISRDRIFDIFTRVKHE
jgi:hypothetical protein